MFYLLANAMAIKIIMIIVSTVYYNTSTATVYKGPIFRGNKFYKNPCFVWPIVNITKLETIVKYVWA